MIRPSHLAAVSLAAFAGSALAGPSPPTASPFKPGKWDIAVTIDSVQVQGGAAGMGAAVAGALKGKTTHVAHCLTPAEAAKGANDMLSGKSGCTMPKRVMANGRISGEMICHNGASTSHMAQDGGYTPVSFKLKSRVVETGGSMPMTMDMTQVGTRVGDC